MNDTLPPRFYLTGTDTDVGKTITAALLCRVLGLDYWKPVQAGLDEETDSQVVERLAGVRVHPERHRLLRPASPHAAAGDEGLQLSPGDFTLPDAPRLLVEGAGGWMVPYATEDSLDAPVFWQSDLVRRLGLPVLVVARSGLGTLNHTLLTLRALRSDGVDCLGLVLVGPEHAENERDLARLGGVSVLARIERVGDPGASFEALATRLGEQLDATLDPSEEPEIVRHEEHPVWHPFTQLQGFSPRGRVVSARGAWLELESGHRVLDGISSWWVNVLGHGHPRIAEAIAEQARRFDQVILADFTHGPAEALTDRLGSVLPGDLRRVFFSDDGSTSVEVGLKMALQAQRLRNETERTRFVAFTGAYHGDTVGAMSVGERGPFTEAFSEMLFDVDVLPYGDAAAATAYFREHGHQVVAAIVEPLVQGAAGMVFQSVPSLASLARDVQDAGALLIADEVMTGWGRTGTLFAVEQAGVVPDILCCSKGITGGTLPLGLTACREHVFETFLGRDKQTAFLHGHSYTGNPIACAAALATLDLFEEVRVLDRVAVLESGYRRAAPAFAELPGVTGVRFRGGVFAFELPGAGGYFDPAGRRLADACFPHGLYIRPLGNVVYLLPPYCLDPAELDWALGLLLEQTRILLNSPDGRATTES